MSTRRIGKSKQRARRSAHSSRKPADDSLVVFDGLIREILDTQGPDVLGSGDPLQAEMWASYLVGLFGRHPLMGEPDTVAAIGGRFVSLARRARTPVAGLSLQALAAVTSGELARRASTAARGAATPRSSAPGWIELIGAAEPTAGWRATDLCGDQDSVMVGFSYPDGAEHTVVVLIDHALGGIAKDIAVVGPLGEVTAMWRDTSEIDLAEEPIEVAAGRVIDAMELTSVTIDAPVGEDYRDSEALVRARLGPVAVAPPDNHLLALDEREALVRAFLADPAGRGYADDSGAWFLLDVMVDYRCDAQRGDPLRWSTGVALLFLLDFVPRKVTADHDNLARFPDVLRAWVPWAAKRAGLQAQIAEETLEAIDDIESQFGDAIADEARWGPAKTVAMGMLAAGVDRAMSRPPTRGSRSALLRSSGCRGVGLREDGLPDEDVRTVRHASVTR